MITEAQVHEALSHVNDPEIRRPITDLGMVENITIDGAHVSVTLLLTVAGCPMRDTLTTNVKAVVEDLEGVDSVTVTMNVMTDTQRQDLITRLRGENGAPAQLPFNQESSTTRVYAVASGKGGVGKSSVTANLACALAAQGLHVGIVDADIYGHSIPGIMGSSQRPTPVQDMIMPPVAHGVKLISIANFTQGNAPIIWRGPMLHRALQQFLSDVYWGDLDVLLVDMPPGTGDVALSIAQLLPRAEILVVTTPQAAAADVAERAGSIAQQTGQRVAGVIENMGAMVLPDGTTMDIFGTGGGQVVADRLSIVTGQPVRVIGHIPLDPELRKQGDAGTPIVLAQPESPAAQAFQELADKLATRSQSLVGKNLGATITTTQRGQ